MKMKMAVVASLLLVSVQLTSTQYVYWGPIPGAPNGNEYYQGRDITAAERDLAETKARRDRARRERELTGKSDNGARLRLQEECYRALERGLENNVRRSYGCSD
jgi:hypothetical protein